MLVLGKLDAGYLTLRAGKFVPFDDHQWSLLIWLRNRDNLKLAGIVCRS